MPGPGKFVALAETELVRLLKTWRPATNEDSKSSLIALFHAALASTVITPCRSPRTKRAPSGVWAVKRSTL